MEAARPSLTPRHTNLEEAYDAVRLCSTTAAATPTPRCPLSSATSPAYRRVREIVQLRVDWFDGANLLGRVDAAVMTRVDAALRVVQDL
ncbi:hypothetical protein GCM10010310_63820 [Streptomyces violaceolatus]|uniref:Uncharacterized protein n=1 Tax=Streptomyces violaceolatus TaxID=67378 RepID=A0ABN3TC08_9ACTN